MQIQAAMKGMIVCIALSCAAIAQTEPGQLEPLPPREQVVLRPVPADGQTIATPADTFTITNIPEMRANVSVEKGLVLVLPAAGQKFVMYLKFSADAVEGGQLVSEKQMQDAIAKLSEAFLAESEEGKPRFKSIKYSGRGGWYALFTDKRLAGVQQPRADDYRYAVVGLLRLSEGSMLQFTLMVNDLASPDFYGPLNYAMKFAKPLPASQPTGK